MTADDSHGRLDDDHYPAYITGRPAELLDITQASCARSSTPA